MKDFIALEALQEIAVKSLLVGKYRKKDNSSRLCVANSLPRWYGEFQLSCVILWLKINSLKLGYVASYISIISLSKMTNKELGDFLIPRAANGISRGLIFQII